eukprot:524561-Pelagomonas_calceolata.AAC.1
MMVSHCFPVHLSGLRAFASLQTFYCLYLKSPIKVYMVSLEALSNFCLNTSSLRMPVNDLDTCADQQDSSLSARCKPAFSNWRNVSLFKLSMLKELDNGPKPIELQRFGGKQMPSAPER